MKSGQSPQEEKEEKEKEKEKKAPKSTKSSLRASMSQIGKCSSIHQHNQMTPLLPCSFRPDPFSLLQCSSHSSSLQQRRDIAPIKGGPLSSINKDPRQHWRSLEKKHSMFSPFHLHWGIHGGQKSKESCRFAIRPSSGIHRATTGCSLIGRVYPH